MSQASRCMPLQNANAKCPLSPSLTHCHHLGKCLLPSLPGETENGKEETGGAGRGLGEREGREGHRHTHTQRGSRQRQAGGIGVVAGGGRRSRPLSVLFLQHKNAKMQSACGLCLPVPVCLHPVPVMPVPLPCQMRVSGGRRRNHVPAQPQEARWRRGGKQKACSAECGKKVCKKEERRDGEVC